MQDTAAYTSIDASGPKRTVELDGRALTIEDLTAISRRGAQVRLSAAGIERVRRGHELLLEAARQGMPIYGFNRGPGELQGVTTFEGDPTSPENEKLLTEHNLRRFRGGAASGVGPEVDHEEIVRAAMLARLNAMLNGCSGASTGPVQMLVEMLNRRLAPVLQSRGSVGQSDFPVMANIAAAMVGEGDAHLNGVRMPARDALHHAGIAPLAPVDRDYGSLISSNAYAAGRAALLVGDLDQLLDWADRIYALSLQAHNGNISPLLEPVQSARPYSHQVQCATSILELLKDSDLLHTSNERRLQDPLSFRNVTQVHGAARRAVALLRTDMLTQLNSSDDNPTVAVDASRHPLHDTPAADAYRLATAQIAGVVMPSANYDPTIWVQSVALVTIALVQLATASTQRATHFRDTTLGPPPDGRRHETETSGDAYAIASLLADTQPLGMPTPAPGQTLATGIEDLATFAPRVVAGAAELVDNVYRLLAHELLFAAVCVERRRDRHPELALGHASDATLAWLREHVPRHSVTPPQRPPGDIVYELLRDTAAPA